MKKRILEALKKHYLGIGIFALVLVRIAAAFPIDNTYFIGGTDASSHLFKAWFVSEYGFAGWSEFWYGGFPFLAHYPPLFYIMSGYLGQLTGYLSAYKIVIDFFFILLPVVFFLFLKEFGMKKENVLVATAIFSLLPIYSYYLYDGRHAALISFFFSLFYWKFLKKAVDGKGTKYVFASSTFLLFSLMTHHLTGFIAVIVSLAWLFSYKISFNSILLASKPLLIAMFLFSIWFLPFAFEDFSPTGSGIINLGTTPTVASQVLTAYYLSDFSYFWAPYVVGPLIAFLILLIILSFSGIRNEPVKRSFLAVLVAIILIFMVMSYKRSLFFIPIPISILASYSFTRFGSKKTRYFLFIVLVTLLLAGFFSLRGQTFSENDFPQAPKDGRVLFLPVGGLSGEGINKNMYEVLLTATNGNENILGWHGESQSKAKENYNSLISKPQQKTQDEYYDLLKRGWVNYLIVKKDTAEENYFLQSERFRVVNESQRFYVFELVPKASYIEINGEYVNASVSRAANRIGINAVCLQGEMRIKETFDKGWSATVNGKTVGLAADEYGFMKAGINESGNCAIEMKYNPYWFILR